MNLHHCPCGATFGLDYQTGLPSLDDITWFLDERSAHSTCRPT